MIIDPAYRRTINTILFLYSLLVQALQSSKLCEFTGVNNNVWRYGSQCRSIKEIKM